MMNASKPVGLEICTDIPGLDLIGSTIPPELIVTISRPDLVLIKRREKSVYVLELPCRFEKNTSSTSKEIYKMHISQS